jgi:meso-butanediol dehydrogenase/(S,S)-butanediol dehydrogenase/diacetyl reductase
MENRFSGKVAIITGGASGIGEATARRFVEEGASVVITDRMKEKIERVAQSLPKDRALVHVADVSVRADCDALVAVAVERFGRLDTVVNSAGVNVVGAVSETTDEVWRNAIGTDLDSIFYITRAALPHLVSTKGSIINIGSVSSLGGGWSHAAYCAAKAAMANLSKAVAIDMAADGVRVNTVCPGLTDTPMVESIMGNEEVLKKGLERIPMKRVARPEEIASVIAFLASEDASYVTGAALPVDGGLVATDGGPKWAT